MTHKIDWATFIRFIAYPSISQSLATSTFTKLAYDSVNENIGNCFNTSTGFFTAPVTGSYLFTLSVLIANGSGAHILGITKNGTVEFARLYESVVNAGNNTLKCL